MTRLTSLDARCFDRVVAVETDRGVPVDVTLTAS